MAQTVRAPLSADTAGAVLVKHDKEDNGRGRKLGHYKNRGRDDDENEADDDSMRGSSTRSSGRSSTRSSRSGNMPTWVNPAPAPPYYAPPGYGNSYAPYDYPPPAYYRGY